MSIELTTQITAMHTTDKEFEEHNCATWKAKCSNYNLVFYGKSYEEVIDEACKKIEELYTSGNLQLVNQRGLRVRRGTQKVVVEVSIGVNPNKSLADFMPEEKEQKQEDKTSLAYYISEVLGFKTEEEFKKHLEEDPSRAARIDLGYKCWLFKKTADAEIDGAAEERDPAAEESERTILGVPVEDWKKEGVSKIEFSSPGHEPECIIIDETEAKK